MSTPEFDPMPPSPRGAEGGDSENEPIWPEVDRRAHADRRAQPTGALSAMLGLRRRRAGRRDGETHDIYVDRFHAVDVALLIGIFALNIGDAAFTLLWLQRGGGEANPLMDWMIQQGDHVFLVQKCIVVGLWLVFLVVHKNFKLARWGMYSMAGVYALLILYHFVLVASGVDPVRGPVPDASAASEQTRHERGDGGLYAQDALAERDRLEARRR